MVRFLLGVVLISIFLNGFLIATLASIDGGEQQPGLSIVEVGDRLALDSHGRGRLAELGGFVAVRHARRLADQEQIEREIIDTILGETQRLDQVSERLDHWLDLDAAYRYRVVEQLIAFSTRLTVRQREELARSLENRGLFESLERLQ